MTEKFSIDEIPNGNFDEEATNVASRKRAKALNSADGKERDLVDLGGSASSSSTGSQSTPEITAGSEEAAIKLLSEQMYALGYHPVILIGSSNSGKTSLLLSLFAAVTTRVELQATVHLNNNIISANSPYGNYLRRSSHDFFQSKLTNFIEGRAAAQTKVPLPFFIPVDFTASSGETVKIAFMEGNGEWFQPQRTEDGSIFSAKLNSAVEQFVKGFSGGMSFVYLLPFTQRESGQSDGYSMDEDLAKKNAGLAIKGVIDQYRDIREGNTSQDRHLLLVTKWDAKFDPRNLSGDKLYDTLSETIDDVKEYLDSNVNYRSAVVAFQGLADVKAKNVRNYCAGRIKGRDIDWPHRDHDFYEAINQFPIELWRWIYSGAYGVDQTDPFPKIKGRHPIIEFFVDIVSKLVG